MHQVTQHLIFRDLPVGVIVFSSTDILFTNDKAAEIFGLSSARLNAMTVADLESFFVQDGRSRPSCEEQSLKHILASRTPLNNLERRIRCPGNAEDIRILLSTSPEVSPEGDLLRVVVTFTDITDRRCWCYRGIFEHMTEGCAYCRMIFENGQAVDWVYLAVNKAFSSLTGLKDVVGKCVSEVIPGLRETDPEIFEIYVRVALTGRPEKFEIRVRALDLWLSVSVFSPERNFFVAVFDVVNERKRIEAEREQLLADTRRAYALLSAEWPPCNGCRNSTRFI